MEITHILQHLFNKDSLEDIPVGKLEEMTAQYPYFATGHFLLSKKLKQAGSESFRSTLQKTNLYFNDTLWLHHLLEDDHGHPDEPGSAINITDLPSSAAVTTAVSTVDVSAAAAVAVPASETVAAASEDIQESGPVVHPASEKLASPFVENIPENESEPVSPDHPAANPDSVLPENQCPERDTTPVPEPEAATDIQSTASEPQLAEKEPVLTFDPYHTIDYFASLGIRLSNEIKPDDKLGNQLKSFTQWLKTMKKLPSGVVENTGQMEPFENARIEKIAAHSLEEKEIITEAMAEVLVKQGKTEKAKAVYHKLSLLNPGKIAYFAAKIDELK